MPIKFLIKQDFGDKVYLCDDPEQVAYTLVGISIMPGNAIVYVLSSGAEVFEVYSFQASFERDEALRLNFGNSEEN